MIPTQELIDDLRRSKVDQARRMDPVQRLLSGPELFDYACRAAISGIRHDHPDADEAQVLAILRERLDRRERREWLEIEP